MKERKLFYPAQVGGAFLYEMKEAGLGQVPVSATQKGLNFSPEADEEDIKSVLALLEKHDPELPAPDFYKEERRRAFPSPGDQLDVAYKDRVNRRFVVGQARKALSKEASISDELRDILELMLRAMDLGDDADLIDGRIRSVKSKFK